MAFSTGLLVCVLLLSSFGKVGRTSGTLAAMSALRVPGFLRRRGIAQAVPVVETALALGLLLPSAGRQAAAAASALMLVVFTVLLIGVLRRGDDVDCGCFGALTTNSRVTFLSVLRNAALIAVAVLIATLGGDASPFLIAIFEADLVSQLALTLGWALVAIGVLACAVVSARRAKAPTGGVQTGARPQSNPAPMSPLSVALGLDPSRAGEVEMGSPLPAVELVTDRGQPRLLADIGDGQPTLLVFLSADCGDCRTVAESVPSWQRALPGTAIRIATSSDPDRLAAAYPHLSPLARFGSRAAIAALGVQRSPAAVFLGTRSQPIVASPIAYGAGEIDGLVHSIKVAQR